MPRLPLVEYLPLRLRFSGGVAHIVFFWNVIRLDSVNLENCVHTWYERSMAWQMLIIDGNTSLKRILAILWLLWPVASPLPRILRRICRTCRMIGYRPAAVWKVTWCRRQVHRNRQQCRHHSKILLQRRFCRRVSFHQQLDAYVLCRALFRQSSPIRRKSSLSGVRPYDW